jgi:hypothetical protein
MTLAESPVFIEADESHTKPEAPTMEVARRYPVQLLIAIGADPADQPTRSR